MKKKKSMIRSKVRDRMTHPQRNNFSYFNIIILKIALNTKEKKNSSLDTLVPYVSIKDNNNTGLDLLLRWQVFFCFFKK